MSEFLHHVIANREYRQYDIELQRAISQGLAEWVDPWNVFQPHTREEQASE
jgi:hypothetical protein